MARLPAPNAIVAVPRSTAARPIVAITTAITGRPISGRSTTRSRPKPSTTMPAIASSSAEPERRAGDIGGAGREKAGEHDELALGEVDRVGRLVDQHEAERDQRVHQPDHHAVGQQDQRELPFELRHRRVDAASFVTPPSAARAPATTL